jgi:hypothetical protein
LQSSQSSIFSWKWTEQQLPQARSELLLCSFSRVWCVYQKLHHWCLKRRKSSDAVSMFCVCFAFWECRHAIRSGMVCSNRTERRTVSAPVWNGSVGWDRWGADVPPVRSTCLTLWVDVLLKPCLPGTVTKRWDGLNYESYYVRNYRKVLLYKSGTSGIST